MKVGAEGQTLPVRSAQNRLGETWAEMLVERHIDEIDAARSGRKWLAAARGHKIEGRSSLIPRSLPAVTWKANLLRVRPETS